MGILQMPIEIIRLIVENLDPDDLLHLALCGRRFQYILLDQNICRIVLHNAGFSHEYDEACLTGDYARALRRLVKRRDAIQRARPFQVLKVTQDAIDFMYANSVLCFTTDQYCPARQHCLRFLCLQGPAVHEAVIDVLHLIEKSGISDFQQNQPYEFKPLYYANGIISCLYTQTKQHISSSWLLVFDSQGAEILYAHPLMSTIDIFVRNNRDFLYYGTRSEPGGDGDRRWVLRGLSFIDGEWIPQRLVLWDFIGADIGSTICFEIFDGHFYGLSSQELVDSGEARWNSFYYAFRFCLGHHSTTQVLPKSLLWRRKATEGPIDDRWSSLELSRDEASGKIFILETRKEWLHASSQSQRTCYKKELVFSPDVVHENMMDDIQDPEGWDGDNHDGTRPLDSLHHGDGGTSPNTFTFHNSPVRSYNASCRAFVDLVNNPPVSHPTTKRLQLRVRPQLLELRPEVPADQSILIRPSDADVVGAREDVVRFWPAVPDPELPDPDLEELYGILNPLGNFDEVDWAIDDRFLVYSPRRFNHNREPRTVVLVSFDPGLRLHRLRKWYSGSATCSRSSQSFSSGKAENPVDFCLCRLKFLANTRSKRAHEDMAAKSTSTSFASWLTSTACCLGGMDVSPRGFDLSL